MSVLFRMRCCMARAGQCLAVAIAMAIALVATPNEATPAPAKDLGLQELLNVTVVSATLHEQSVRQAPAAVSVINADEIRRYGYRTLAEAISSTPGFFDTYDHTYQSTGIRGMSVPGDWQSRMLILLDGHALTDNLFSSGGGLGYDFPVDMSLIKRIEIVRGPSSALYGSNGIFATVNIITVSPAELSGSAVNVNAASQGGRGATITTARQIGRVRALISASGWLSSGQNTVIVPGLLDSAGNGARAVGVDGETSTRFFARVIAGHWSVWSVVGDRKKVQPVSWGETIIGDTGTRADDARAMLVAEYAREFTSSRRLAWRVTWDSIFANYDARYASEDGSVIHNREEDRGDWLTSQVVWTLKPHRRHTLTTGTDLKVDIRASLVNVEVSPIRTEYGRVSTRDQSVGLFVQDELALSRSLTAVVAGRWDYSARHGGVISPKISLVWDMLPQTTWKLIAGRGMRNPSAYESLYTDGMLVAANPLLRPERVNTLEAVWQHRFTRSLEATVDAYAYSLKDVIASYADASGVFQYQNLGRLTARGVEVSLHKRLGGSGGHVAASISWQRGHRNNRLQVPNSPGLLSKVRASLPVWRSGITAAGMLDYISERRTEAFAILSPALVSGVTLTTRPISHGLRLEGGIRNLTNVSYFDPVSFITGVDVMPRLGRTAFIRLAWQQATD